MQLLRIPASVLIPIIGVVCVVGAKSVNASMFDVWLMIGAGVAAYVMKIAEYPVAPLILAFVLAPGSRAASGSLSNISNGDPTIFVSRPIAATLLAIMLAIIVFAVVSGIGARRRAAA